MGLKTQTRNYFYILNNYPLSEKTIEFDQNKKTILVLDSQIPTFDKDSASNRLTEIVKFLGKHFNVYLMDWGKAVPKAESKKYIKNFNEHNVTVYEPYINKFGLVSGRKNFLKKIIPKLDFVWCHRPELFHAYLHFFRKNAPQVKIIYDMVDVHYLRLERGLEIKFDKKRQEEVIFYKHVETELSKEADRIAVISDKEKDFMKSFVDESKLYTISNVHNLKIESSEAPSFQDRKGIFFVGTFLHDPNVDAVEQLYHHIMPLVWKKLPDLEVTIIGEHASKSINEMNSPLFQIKGYVEDIIPYYKKCFASVAPLRFGAGVKGKIGQSLEYLLPVVTTDIGAEGMFLENGKTALISDERDLNAFAENIIRICTDETLWNELHKNSAIGIEPFTIKAQEKEILKLLS